METCIHGKELWARCEQCEHMTPTPPVDSSGNRLNAGEPVVWVSVPSEPTSEMKMAGMEEAPLCVKQHYGKENPYYTGKVSSFSDAECGDIYRAMIAAAPSHPQPNAGVVTDALEIFNREFNAECAEMWDFDCPANAESESYKAGMVNLGARIQAALSAAPKPECTIVHSEDPSAPAYLAHGAVKVTRERCGE